MALGEGVDLLDQERIIGPLRKPFANQRGCPLQVEAAQWELDQLDKEGAAVVGDHTREGGDGRARQEVGNAALVLQVGTEDSDHLALLLARSYKLKTVQANYGYLH